MNPIITIAHSTFRECVRSKVLYSVLFFALVLIGLALFFGRVTIGDQLKVLKDFGLFAISLSSIAIGVITGGQLLHKELAKKTIYNLLSKAVTRSEFIVGKFLGMVFLLAALIFLMGLFLTAFLWGFEGHLEPLLFQAYYFLFLEAVILCGGAIFFSSIVVTPILNGFFTFGLFLAGRSAGYIADFASLTNSNLIKVLYWILPHFDELNISNGIVYGEARSIENIIFSSVYAGSYALALVALASIFFARRDFN